MRVVRDRLNIHKLRQRGLMGTGVTVAIIDTGVSPHLDFVLVKNRIKAFWSYEYGVCQPYDDNGHGTSVCGILAGSGLASGGVFEGVAPKCSIVGIKAISQSGSGSAQNILDGMRFIAKHRQRLDIRVVCMSLGSVPTESDPLMRAAEALWDMGVVVVASCGNNGPNHGTVSSPAASPVIITVGGMDYDDAGNPFVVDFSSRGPYLQYERPDIVAPAVNIISCCKNGMYAKNTGTSMAAPVVAGLAALMIEEHPDYTNNRVKFELLKRAARIDTDPNADGKGLVSVFSLKI